jgi:arabinan endo-1,5-alpha-L-arabinosidase
VIADGSGQLWIAYGGIFAGLSIRKLNSAGTVSDPTTEINIAVDNYYTNPYILFKNGFFYEFATPAGACCSGAFSTYSVRVGRSTSITGPYLDAEGNDMNAFSAPSSQFAPGGDTVLVMTGNDIVGPGSNVVFTDESGQDYILYSGVSKAQQYLPNVTGFTARQLMMDAVDWINGWPTTRSGAGPSDVTTPQPVPAAQPSASNGYVPPIVMPDTPGTAIAASSDDFNETTLSSQWTFLHVPGNFTMTGSTYSVQSVSQESVVASSMPNLPILAEPEPAGNYMLEVKLSTTVSPTAFFTTNPQAGIFIYSSDTNYLRLDEFPDFDTRQIEYLDQFGTGAFSFAPVGTPNFYNSTYFRIVKRVGTGGAPDTYTSYSSLDGVTYLRGPAWTASYGSTGKIGLFAGNTAGFTVSFDYIHVTTVTP